MIAGLTGATGSADPWDELVTMAARTAGLALPDDVRVEVLKAHKKSRVFRLLHTGGSLVAKRARVTTLATERFLYQDLLPSLGGSYIHCLGESADADSSFAWLFLEDAGEVRFAGRAAPERFALGRLLGELHAATRDVGRDPAVPVRTTDGYLADLRAAHGRLTGAAVGLDFTPAAREMLEAVATQLNVVEAHWEPLVAAVGRTGTVLAHGDIQARNVRLRPDSSGRLQVLLLDWELAAWDSPAIDLQSAVDVDDPMLGGYVDAGGGLLEMDVRLAFEVASYGRVLRLIHSINWATSYLDRDYPQRGVQQLVAYRSALDAAMGRLGFT